MHIRYRFASLQCDILSLHRKDRFQGDKLCVHTLHGLLEQEVVFPSFRSLRKPLVPFFFLSSTMQFDSNVFRMPSFFCKLLHIEDYLHSLRTAVWSTHAAKKTLSRGFLDHVPRFYQVLFCLASSKFTSPGPASIISDQVVYTDCLDHFWYEMCDWYDCDIFIHFPIWIFFNPDKYGTGIKINRHPNHIHLV